MQQKGAVETHFANCTVFTISNHISGGVIGVKYNDVYLVMILNKKPMRQHGFNGRGQQRKIPQPKLI